MQTIVSLILLAGVVLCDDKGSEFLEKHNTFRAAEQVPLMTYNDSIAANAQKYASNCNFKHSSYGARTNVTGFEGYVGENLYISSNGNGDPVKAVGSWYNEKQYYDRDNNNCSYVCGHYTQLIWSTSTSLGCGYKTCPEVDVYGSIWENALLVVCQYGPGGNYAGVSPFGSNQRKRDLVRRLIERRRMEGSNDVTRSVRDNADDARASEEGSNSIETMSEVL